MGKAGMYPLVLFYFFKLGLLRVFDFVKVSWGSFYLKSKVSWGGFYFSKYFQKLKYLLKIKQDWTVVNLLDLN